MANKTYTQKIQFKGSFDAGEVLSALKKVRQGMIDAGADSNLFKGIDKDISATEKQINEMLAQIKKGFSNPQEIKAFEKQLDKLSLSFSKISTGLENLNVKDTFKNGSKEVQQYSQQLKSLEQNYESVTRSMKDNIEVQLKAAKLKDNEINEIQKEIEAQGDLEEALKKVGKAKEQAAKSRQGKKGLDTEKGQGFISSRTTSFSASDLGIVALTGTAKKGVNDARKRSGKGNRLTGTPEAREVDFDKADVAIVESYKKALEETIKSGGVATDAIAAMKKNIEEYGISLKDVEKLQESFDKDLEEFNKTVLNQQQRGAITSATHLGTTDASGQFNLSEEGQNIANNTGVQEYNTLVQQIANLEQRLAVATETARQNTEEAMRTTAESTRNAVDAQERFESAAQESANALYEDGEAAAALNDKFEGIKDSIKTFLSISGAISGIKSVIQETFEDIKELDASFASIAMVTDYSVAQMWDSYDQYAEMANELGQSTKDVIASSALFYQQGLDTNEALELTTSTMKLATLAGSDFETATSQMTAALRGFNMEMTEGERITDVYSELAAKAAADVDGIAYAMGKTASIASSAGMEFETTSAFLTQMIETTQEAPKQKLIA